MMTYLKNAHVELACLFVLMVLLTQSSVVGFYTNTTIGSIQGQVPNITCWSETNIGTVNTIIYSFFGIPYMYSYVPYADACVFIKQNGTSLNGSEFHLFFAGSLVGTNLYRHMTYRCGSNFSPLNTFIGYGRCTPFPYETWTTDLCICSTNYCNLNYSTCIASVQGTSARPPNLSIFVPELNNIISCYTAAHGSTYTYMYDDSLTISQIGAPMNMTAYRAYYETHAAVCVILVNENNGDWYQSTLVYEQYEAEFYRFLLMNTLGLLNRFYESATSVTAQLQYSYVTDSYSFYNATICYCTTNNCNLNLATCVAGVNNSSPSLSTSPSSSTPPSTTTYLNTTSSNISNTLSSTLTTTTSTKIQNISVKQAAPIFDQRYHNFLLLIFIFILQKLI